MEMYDGDFELMKSLILDKLNVIHEEILVLEKDGISIELLNLKKEQLKYQELYFKLVEKLYQTNY